MKDIMEVGGGLNERRCAWKKITNYCGKRKGKKKNEK